MATNRVMMNGIAVNVGQTRPAATTTRAEFASLQTQFSTAKARLDELSARVGVQNRSISGRGWGPPVHGEPKRMSAAEKEATVRQQEAARHEVDELATNILAKAHGYLETNAPGSIKPSAARAEGQRPADIEQGAAYQALAKGTLVEFLDRAVAASNVR